MSQNYYPPRRDKNAFTCPFCNVYAVQSWQRLDNSGYEGKNLHFSYCNHCYKKGLWLDAQMIFPKQTNISMPNEDLAEDVKELYLQARNIYSESPRGACALLRLAVQKLCIQLGEKGKDLNTDIANLVKKGLPEKIQKALDIVRLVGNNAVHPGLIVIEDNLEMASSLFELINIIAEKMISEPNRLNELYNSLPQSKLDEISKRDGN